MSKKIVRSIIAACCLIFVVSLNVQATSLETDPPILANNLEKKAVLLPCSSTVITSVSITFIPCGGGEPMVSSATVNCTASSEHCPTAEFAASQCSYIGAIALANSQIPICPPGGVE